MTALTLAEVVEGREVDEPSRSIKGVAVFIERPVVLVVSLPADDRARV